MVGVNGLELECYLGQIRIESYLGLVEFGSDWKWAHPRLTPPESFEEVQKRWDTHELWMDLDRYQRGLDS